MKWQSNITQQDIFKLRDIFAYMTDQGWKYPTWLDFMMRNID